MLVVTINYKCVYVNDCKCILSMYMICIYLYMIFHLYPLYHSREDLIPECMIWILLTLLVATAGVCVLWIFNIYIYIFIFIMYMYIWIYMYIDAFLFFYTKTYMYVYVYLSMTIYNILYIYNIIIQNVYLYISAFSLFFWLSLIVEESVREVSTRNSSLLRTDGGMSGSNIFFHESVNVFFHARHIQSIFWLWSLDCFLNKNIEKDLRKLICWDWWFDMFMYFPRLMLS